MAEEQGRVQQAEEIIRALNRLIDAMYNSDLESSWPKDAVGLQAQYEQAYGVQLDAAP